MDFWIPCIYALSNCGISYYSLCNYSVIKAPVFIGLQNYKALFQDKVFLKTISNTLYMMCLGVPITTIIAVGVSVMLNHKKLNQTYTGIIRVLFSCRL